MNNPQKHITLKKVKIGNDLPFVLIAGPCQLESRQHGMEISIAIKEICDKIGISFIYKSSFDKANRTSIAGKRGLGLEAALPIMAEIGEFHHIPVLTDIHEISQCVPVAEAVDLLQIPAFLCRQTDLLIAAAQTGKAINVKKGQFLAPWDMVNVAKKISDSGNSQIMLCERGVSFGYNTLVTDMRALPIMAKTGYPVVIDATHCVQQPGGAGDSSGGDRTMVPAIARAAIAVGVACVFLETHHDPDHAPSDGPNMVRLQHLPKLLETLQSLDKVSKETPFHPEDFA